MNNQEILKIALKAAVSAGNILSEHNKEKLKISQKESLRDIVTEIDKISENKIISILSEFDSEVTILTEEKGRIDGKKENVAWVIDALDGTVNYVNSIPHYGVSIAFMENRIPIVGVIFNPFSSELYYGAKDLGVFKNQNHIKVVDKPHNEGLFTVAFSGKNYDPENRIEEFVRFGEINDGTRGCLRTGSAAMNLAYLAEGRFSGCWGKANKIWDIAAGILIANLAGAKINFTEVDKTNNLVSYLAAVPSSWDYIYKNVETALGLSKSDSFQI